MTDKKKTVQIIGGIAVFVFIVVNILLVYKIKTSTFSEKPFAQYELKKPTLFVVFQEFECQSCIDGLKILNDFYHQLKEQNTIDIKGIILSEANQDRKNLSAQFDFPIEITDSFNIINRLYISNTPLLVGVSRNHEIVYSELVPAGPGISEKYLKEGIINRLYYSEHIGSEKN